MSFEYKLIINDTKPTSQVQGTFWLHKTSGILFVAIDDYRQVASSLISLSSISDNNKWMTTIESLTEPLTYDVGSIWIQDNKRVWVYLDRWIPITGATL